MRVFFNFFKKKKKFELCKNCCEAATSYEFSYDRMFFFPKNPKLKYRENGDIDFDPKSRLPTFVDYNNTREAIRQAKNIGQNHVHFRMSVAVAEQIVTDGYTDHNDKLDTISW